MQTHSRKEVHNALFYRYIYAVATFLYKTVALVPPRFVGNKAHQRQFRAVMAIQTMPATIYQTLSDEYGLMMDSAGLRRVFCFRSQAGLRNAVARGALPVRTFGLEGRRGIFAFTADVAQWLTTVQGRREAGSDRSISDPTDAPLVVKGGVKG